MTNDPSREFMAYIGDADIHDGHIRKVDEDEDRVRVTIEGAGGEFLTIEFQEVLWKESHRPEGMLLYAVAEWKGEGSVRRFVFANWEEEDDASLEIGARDYRVIK